MAEKLSTWCHTQVQSPAGRPDQSSISLKSDRFSHVPLVDSRIRLADHTDRLGPNPAKCSVDQVYSAGCIAVKCDFRSLGGSAVGC